MHFLNFNLKYLQMSAPPQLRMELLVALVDLLTFGDSVDEYQKHFENEYKITSYVLSTYGISSILS